MNKKIWSLFLCLALALVVASLLPTRASAATEGDYTYLVDSG